MLESTAYHRIIVLVDVKIRTQVDFQGRTGRKVRWVLGCEHMCVRECMTFVVCICLFTMRCECLTERRSDHMSLNFWQPKVSEHGRKTEERRKRRVLLFRQ